MRKSLLGFVVLALCFAFSGTTAHAQTIVNMCIVAGCGPGTSGALTFTAGPSETSTASFNSLAGNAYWGTTTGTYTISSGAVTLTEIPPETNTYTASSTPLTLTLTSKSGPAGSLTGTITNLEILTQSGAHGGINESLVANVTVLSASGSLGVYSGIAGVFDMSFSLPTSTDIDNLTSTTQISGGYATLTPTPEPASMLLFGSGLLVLGGALRRRLRVA